MNGQLLIKTEQKLSLDMFVAALPNILGCDRWKQRNSSNYVEERYFRCTVLGIEILVCIADETEYPDYDFTLWIKHIASVAEKSFVYGLIDCVARLLAVHGYDVLCPHDSRKGSGGVLYRLDISAEVNSREQVATEEV